MERKELLSAHTLMSTETKPMLQLNILLFQLNLESMVRIKSNFTEFSTGVSKVHPLPKLNEFEQAQLKQAVDAVKKNIETGVKFASS